jgi:hypothetical protein
MQAQWLVEILIKNHPEPSGINQKFILIKKFSTA